MRQKNNKATCINCVIICNSSFPPPSSSAEKLVFRGVFLKQAPVCCNSLQFANNTRVLEITIRHPDFDYTEILFGWNRYTVYNWNNIHIGRNRFTNCDIWQLLPRSRNLFICDLVWEATAITILRVFPHWNNASSHQKQHTIHNKFGRKNFEYWDCLFGSFKIAYLLITRCSPIRIMGKMRP